MDIVLLYTYEQMLLCRATPEGMGAIRSLLSLPLLLLPLLLLLLLVAPASFHIPECKCRQVLQSHESLLMFTIHNEDIPQSRKKTIPIPPSSSRLSPQSRHFNPAYSHNPTIIIPPLHIIPPHNNIQSAFNYEKVPFEHPVLFAPPSPSSQLSRCRQKISLTDGYKP